MRLVTEEYPRAAQRGSSSLLARGAFLKNAGLAPLAPPEKLFIDRSFWKSRNLFSKRFLAAGGK